MPPMPPMPPMPNHGYVDDEDREDVGESEQLRYVRANGNESSPMRCDDDCDACRYADVDVDDS